MHFKCVVINGITHTAASSLEKTARLAKRDRMSPKAGTLHSRLMNSKESVKPEAIWNPIKY